MKGQTENLAWLNLLRVVASVAVVILHVSAEPVVFIQDRSSALWHAGNVLDSLCRWCIGIFVMVSGALLLDPSRIESASEFFKRRLQRILVPVLFWSAAYFALAGATGQPLTLERVGKLLWQGRPWYHMWYLFMIVGLYAVTPLLRAYVSRASIPIRWGVAVLCLVAACGWNLDLALDRRALPSTVLTMFIPYIGYYLIGYELRRIAPVRLHPGILWAVFSVAAATTVIGTQALLEAYGINRAGLYMYEYLSPNVVLMSVAIFCLASRAHAIRSPAPEANGMFARVVDEVAPLTLGLYLLHPMVVLALRKVGVTAIGTESVFGVLLVAGPAFAVSLALTWVMSRVPLLRQGIGLR